MHCIQNNAFTELDKPSLLVSHSSPLSPSRDQSIGCAETSVRGGACSECTLDLFGKVVCRNVPYVQDNYLELNSIDQHHQ